jgi:hypothetical protein
MAVTTALDSRVDTDAAWAALPSADRTKAVERYPGFVELAHKGGRKVVAGLPAYLRERRFDFIDAKGQAEGGSAAGPPAFFDAFSRPWWWIGAPLPRGQPRRASPTCAGRRRSSFAAWPISPSWASATASRIRKARGARGRRGRRPGRVRKSDPAVKALARGWQRQGGGCRCPIKRLGFHAAAMLDRRPQGVGGGDVRSGDLNWYMVRLRGSVASRDRLPRSLSGAESIIRCCAISWPTARRYLSKKQRAERCRS